MKTRRVLAGGLVAVAAAAAAGHLAAHDFWLVPELFVAPAGWHLHVYAVRAERRPSLEKTGGRPSPRHWQSAPMATTDGMIRLARKN